MKALLFALPALLLAACATYGQRLDALAVGATRGQVLDAMEGFGDSSDTGQAHQLELAGEKPALMPRDLPFGTLDA